MDLSCRSNRYGRQLIYNYCYININKNINITIQVKYIGFYSAHVAVLNEEPIYWICIVVFIGYNNTLIIRNTQRAVSPMIVLDSQAFIVNKYWNTKRTQMICNSNF